MAARRFAIIGAGPAGVAAAHDLARRGLPSAVFEQDGQVGGLSRTVVRGGFRFDVGGHRFFTRNAQVEALWRDVLGEDLLRRPRLSRILYRGKLYAYPLRAANVLRNLGPLASAGVLASFAKRRLLPRRPEASFADWVANRFGDRLFSMFFRAYTEKVWGTPCEAISADWAAQRIRALSLGRAALDALGLRRGRRAASLIEEFDYPRLGAGQMYETMMRRAEGMGATLHLRHEVVEVLHDGRAVTHLRVCHAGQSALVPADGVISSMPLTELVLRLRPPAPDAVLAAARSLRHRAILVANLLVRARDVLPDTWVYLHSPEIRAGRLQLPANWSPHLVPDGEMSSLSLEYFAWEGDELWSRPDAELLEMARADLRALGRAAPRRVEDGFVVRCPRAYPVYDAGYRAKVRAIREHLEGLANLVCAGRYGQFRYNNMDHSILTGLLAVRRLLGERVDPWSVNEEAEYHEPQGPPGAGGAVRTGSR